MAKQLIEMRELPCGVFLFQNIGNIHTHGKLLAITTVERYNSNLNNFPLSVGDLDNYNDLFLVRDYSICNIQDFSSDNSIIGFDNDILTDAFPDKGFLVLFDPITGDRVSCRH